MSTWAQLLNDIRIDLKDTATSKRWSDEALYLYAKDALRDYSMHFPLILRVQLVAQDGAYQLPEGFLKEVAVECPADRFLERRMDRPGVHYTQTTGQPNRYVIGGRTLSLNGSPSEAPILTYEARHPVPANPSDREFVLTVPEEDEELLRLYIKAKAMEQIRTQQSNLDRFREGAGNRDDNPLEPEVGDLMGEYRTKIAERYTGGVIKLFRPGRFK